ncbi:MAG: GIY-YIG nuclease family protein [Flavobacteriales bacterium]|nr:GIY-YIG nuclease family protein [Flavobacteriales bacterium]
MKEIKEFYTNRKGEDFHFEDILQADFNKIPIDKNGVYILRAKSDSFLYPNREKSKIFYIGMSKDLRKRLKTHQRKTKDLIDKTNTERRDYWYWDRYQYAASFGAEVFVFLCKGSQQPKNLEYDIIEHFYDKYLGKPVANGAFSFKK